MYLSPRNVAEVERLDAFVHPRTLARLAHQDAVADEQALATSVHQRLHASTLPGGGEGSALANLASKPTPENVDEWRHFSRAWGVVLEKARPWAIKQELYRRDVLMWHFLELRGKYYQLLGAKDSRVLRRQGNTVYQAPAFLVLDLFLLSYRLLLS